MEAVQKTRALGSPRGLCSLPERLCVPTEAATWFPPAASQGWAGEGGGLGNLPPPGTGAWLFCVSDQQCNSSFSSPSCSQGPPSCSQGIAAVPHNF